MVQSHAFWAKIAQWACYGVQDKPWLPQSDFHRLHGELEEWYNGLPPRQRWSKQNLRGMLAEGKDIVRYELRLLKCVETKPSIRSYSPSYLTFAATN